MHVHMLNGRFQAFSLSIARFWCLTATIQIACTAPFSQFNLFIRNQWPTAKSISVCIILFVLVFFFNSGFGFYVVSMQFSFVSFVGDFLMSYISIPLEIECEFDFSHLYISISCGSHIMLKPTNIEKIKHFTLGTTILGISTCICVLPYSFLPYKFGEAIFVLNLLDSNSMEFR